jgi:hypothetical protein
LGVLEFGLRPVTHAALAGARRVADDLTDTKVIRRLHKFSILKPYLMLASVENNRWQKSDCDSPVMDDTPFPQDNRSASPRGSGRRRHPRKYQHGITLMAPAPQSLGGGRSADARDIHLKSASSA